MRRRGVFLRRASVDRPPLRVALAAAALVAAVGAAAAGAGEGDPTSALYAGSFSVPHRGPQQQAVAALGSAIAATRARRSRIKVVVVSSQVQIGATPQLFDKPDEYAAYVGRRIRAFYGGAVLVVMPSGFGLYDGGRSTTAERNALGSLRPQAADAGSLVAAAISAVQRLAAAQVLDAPDVTPPIVFAFGSVGRRGGTARLRYEVSDDSGLTQEVVRIPDRAGAPPEVVARTALRATDPATLEQVSWQVPADAAALVRFCVVATDAAGNESRESCSLVHVG